MGKLGGMRGVGVGLVAVVVVGCVGLVYWSGPEAGDAPPRPKAQSSEIQEANDVNGLEALPDEPLPLGTLLGCNQPAAPPQAWSIGPAPDDLLDLSTPAVAVYTVLSLLDEGQTDKLGPCFLEEPNDPASPLYPVCLGHPISLLDVTEEEETAQVVWQATVHKMFTRDGKSYSPGETIELTTHLTQVEGTWRLARLHE